MSRGYSLAEEPVNCTTVHNRARREHFVRRFISHARVISSKGPLQKCNFVDLLGPVERQSALHLTHQSAFAPERIKRSAAGKSKRGCTPSSGAIRAITLPAVGTAFQPEVA